MLRKLAKLNKQKVLIMIVITAPPPHHTLSKIYLSWMTGSIKHSKTVTVPKIGPNSFTHY